MRETVFSDVADVVRSFFIFLQASQARRMLVRWFILFFFCTSSISGTPSDTLEGSAAFTSSPSFSVFQDQDIGMIIQEHLINPYYAKPLPPAEDVTVFFEDSLRLWKDLTWWQKIRVNNKGTLEHNQVPENSWGKSHIDSHFMPGGQGAFLDRDPRAAHGSDHATRMAVIAPVFAYLYHKYHPDYKEKVFRDLLPLIQFVGAAHDCGRQTEGPDVYDDDSAAYAKGALINLGITDKSSLAACIEAISYKDSNPMEKKGIVAKCVQNSDSAEFARLLLRRHFQDPNDFEYSRGKLDIYIEMKQLHEDGQIDRATFDEFKEELDALRAELNSFIFTTHQKSFREKASKDGKCYLDEVLREVNKTKVPLLHKIVSQLGIKKSKCRSSVIPPEYITSCLQTCLEILPTELLEEFRGRLEDIPAKEKDLRTIEREINGREETETELYNAIEGQEGERIANAFTALPPISREKCRPELQKFIATIGVNEQVAAESVDIFEDEKLNQELCHLLQSEQVDPQYLVNQAVNLLDRLEIRPDAIKQTTVAKALKIAAQRFLQGGDAEKASGALCLAANGLNVAQMHPLQKLLGSGRHLLASGAPVFIPTGCDSVRRRQLRVCEKIIDNKPICELCFELTVKARQHLQHCFALNSYSQFQTVPFRFMGKKDGAVTEIEIGTASRIKLTENVELEVGNDPGYWNMYHHVRISCKQGISLQEVHQSLARVGLPTALMVSGIDDQKKECLARILHFRFPKKSKLGSSTDPYEIYNTLSEKERRGVDGDLESMKLSLVGPHHLEYVLPSLPKEVEELGGECIGVYISAGGIFGTAEVLADIFQTGLLSTQERFQRGILGHACSPKYNCKAGSANQVFTRLFTENQLTSEYSVSRFPVRGKILIMFDLQAMERLPYFYLRDVAGVRNPDHRVEKHLAEKQRPIKNFIGAEHIAVRPGLEEFVSKQVGLPHPLNEIMFNQTLGPQYIRKIVLERERDKGIVLRVLRSRGIVEINGVSLEEAVVVSSHLTSRIL